MKIYSLSEFNDFRSVQKRHFPEAFTLKTYEIHVMFLLLCTIVHIKFFKFLFLFLLLVQQQISKKKGAVSGNFHQILGILHKSPKCMEHKEEYKRT